MASQDFNFHLPDHLIATQPSSQRDQCKLLVYDRQTKKITHGRFVDVKDYLEPTDLLILNQAKVSPKRLYWTGPKKRKQEMVFLQLLESTQNYCTWEVIVSGKNLPMNQPFVLFEDVTFRILSRHEKLAKVVVQCALERLNAHLQDHGQLPLPPYIRKQRRGQGQPEYSPSDEQAYQTVFAQTSGASAAPTAGLHFTPELLQTLAAQGVQIEKIFLEVGWGTFAPLSQKNFEQKKLHQEYFEIDQTVAEKITRVQQQKKGRVVAVGTTVVRSLETWAQFDAPVMDMRASSELFIFPPYQMKVIDALITNFHLPGSSLLLLVAAMLGQDGAQTLQKIYQEAIDHQYQFYSYGDAMLIL
jgi:S-adenosylmethionine:tRNA ribosyltransferase-isomerase